MSFLSFLLGEKKKSAAVAKERLQIILAHERGLNARRPDYLPQLQRELLEVISKYVSIKAEDIKVHLEKQDALEVLEVKIELPDLPTTASTPAAR
ncbi:cell division topological specificity factor MinE [uncultured Pseudacidovorax sp.]|uniref:cell division topological specificity factor MinE n=1 Tax=uncultured Pseudacidovorax sp. TaxID=679313 RepID=UPI0025E6ECAD|nr:cell division topological specificity factor MinE [uncultured Pseudacidovorax sp.]